MLLKSDIIGAVLKRKASPVFPSWGIPLRNLSTLGWLSLVIRDGRIPNPVVKLFHGVHRMLSISIALCEGSLFGVGTLGKVAVGYWGWITQKNYQSLALHLRLLNILLGTKNRVRESFKIQLTLRNPEKHLGEFW